jgi:CO/xanthine dehydrogenase FAD-binding subunit
MPFGSRWRTERNTVFREGEQVRTRTKVEIDGVAKLRIIVDPDGTVRIGAEADRQNAPQLKKAISLLISDLAHADSEELARMAEEMRQV